jgi:hypothetical protein
VADIATLLQAIAALLWPILGFVALLIFRSQIADIAARLKKGKLLGQEIELNESLTRLDQSAVAVEKEVAALPPPDVSAPVLVHEDEAIREILSEAARSPKAALLLLASELEKAARQVLASVGLLQARKYVPLSQALRELDKQFGLPRHVQSSLKLFWEIRSRLIHGDQAKSEDILRAIDSGVTILKALQALPREVNVVHHPGVDLYGESLCKIKIANIKGVILETAAPGGTSKNLRIFPTTKGHFQKGRRVAWEWDMQSVWGPAWYRNPDTGEPLQAWVSAAEFTGRHLDEV